MIVIFDSQTDESLARGGTFDITGTTLATDKQYWGFHASDGAVLNAILGVALKTAVTDLASITAAEVDLSAMILTGASDPLMGNVLYRVDGYVITNIDLTSGSLHCYKTNTQISA